VIPPWLEPQIERLRGAWVRQRMPHSLLIHESPGSGGEWLGQWAARLVLCEHREEAPCGACVSCRRVAQGAHPDLALVRPTEGSTQIRIEQVRELSAELALTAHQGGFKVGLLAPADTMNRFAANALLKTLEEPPPATLLVLVATQPSRLPATLRSRCQQVRVPAPSRAASIGWLSATRGPGDWAAVLEVLGEAPLLAQAADPEALAALAAEVRGGLEEALAGRGDPGATAERWGRAEAPLRLACIERWLTDRIRAALGAGSGIAEVRAGAHPAVPRERVDLRGLFALLDAVRELKSSFEAPINRGLAFESLLRGLSRTRSN
jgi:DNA polymerase-3 subunit delta'